MLIWHSQVTINNSCLFSFLDVDASALEELQTMLARKYQVL
jgi:hypothetical protein